MLPTEREKATRRLSRARLSGDGPDRLAQSSRSDFNLSIACMPG
jgi:hypothetical protein